MASIALPASAGPGVDLPDLVLTAIGLGDRVREGKLEAWLYRLGRVGDCRRPVRLFGHTRRMTAAGPRVFGSRLEPDGVLLKACGDRREAACPGCAHTYRGDAWQLIAAGLRGGKGVPDSAASHPRVFATLTAPSFGPVHGQRPGPDGTPRVCHPTGPDGVCEHGRPCRCPLVHAVDDPVLGAPLCLDCTDLVGQVLWNNAASELWRRVPIYLRLELAGRLGLTEAELKQRVRVAFVKVAEFQARGTVHLHAILRADGVPGPDQDPADLIPPPAELTAEVLADAVRAAVTRVHAPLPALPGRPSEGKARFGAQLEVHPSRPVTA
jgi:uncharacterized Zn-finger protein